jgi:hypothetical protein
VKNRLLTIPVLAIVLVLVTGCAKLPQTELDAANGAIARAESTNATTYAASEWEAARAAMTAAEVEIETQNAKFALTRSFDSARTLLTEATQKADAAVEATRVAKEEARSESVELLGQVHSTIAETGTLLADLNACGRRPKGFDLDLVALQGQVDGLSTEASAVQTSIDREDFHSAQMQAQEITGRTTTLKSELQTAMTKLSCKPSARTAA